MLPVRTIGPAAETEPLGVTVVLAVRVLARTRRASREKRRRFISGSPQ
jgi:hypothetical protein